MEWYGWLLLDDENTVVSTDRFAAMTPEFAFKAAVRNLNSIDTYWIGNRVDVYISNPDGEFNRVASYRREGYNPGHMRALVSVFDDPEIYEALLRDEKESWGRGVRWIRIR